MPVDGKMHPTYWDEKTSCSGGSTDAKDQPVSMVETQAVLNVMHIGG